MRRGFLKNSKTQKQALSAAVGEPSSVPLDIGRGKLPYGKVENTAVPKDYEPGQFSFRQMAPAPLKTDQPATTVVMTTIPPRTVKGPPSPDGHSELIILLETKQKILNTPGYLQPVPKPVGPPSFVIKSTPEMGTGVFATRDVEVGELIFAERPLLVSPRDIGLTFSLPIEYYQKYDERTMKTIMMMECEKQLEIAVGRMIPEDQTAFKSLMNNHKEDGSGPLLGIIRTNAYDIGLFDGPESLPQEINHYGAVTKIGSRINHSCQPNITHRFSFASFSFQFFAPRDIKAGDQLFFAYCGLDQTVAERQAELAPYGFACHCPACANATPATDKLRKEYEQLIKEASEKIMQWIVQGTISPNKVDESVLDPVLQFREALIKEGLHTSGEYGLLLTAIQQFYEKLGFQEKAKHYMEEYAKYRMAFD